MRGAKGRARGAQEVSRHFRACKTVRCMERASHEAIEKSYGFYIG